MPTITPIANNPLTLWAEMKIGMLSHTNNQERKPKIASKTQFLFHFQSKIRGAYFTACACDHLVSDQLNCLKIELPSEYDVDQPIAGGTNKQSRHLSVVVSVSTYSKLSSNEELHLSVPLIGIE